MRIEFIYGPFSSGNKVFDFNNLYQNPQGLTGSEHSCFEFAKCMSERGHDVYLYTNVKSMGLWHGVKIKSLTEFGYARVPPDVVYSWNEPDMLRYIWEGSLRMVNQQLNDFNFCQPGFDSFVDVYTSPSSSHKEYIKQFTPNSENKWEVISNCYNSDLFCPTAPKRPGSCIWASSVDRGLHLLLMYWPKIRQAVPYATLDIYYPYDHWINSLRDVNPHGDENIYRREFKNRANYIEYALNKMKDGFGITHHKAVSKIDIAKAFSETAVFPYSCSTVLPTEGFSVSSLEAMGGGCVPILSSQDSLGQIYGESKCPMIQTPTTNHMEEFINYTIKALTDEDWANSIREKTIKFAQNFTFRKEVLKLEKLMLDKRKKLNK